MKKIVTELGHFLLAMFPVFFFFSLWMRLLAEDGVLHEIIVAYFKSLGY